MILASVVGFSSAMAVLVVAAIFEKNKMIKSNRVVFLFRGVITLLTCTFVFGCSRSDINDPTLRAWSHWTDSIGTQYKVAMQQEMALAFDSQGKVDGTETLMVECVRDGDFYAIVIHEENGDEYVRLKNPSYYCGLKKPNGTNTYMLFSIAVAGTPEYQSEATSTLRTDPLATLMSGDQLLDYCRIIKVSRSNTSSNGNELQFELELDDTAPQLARDAHLDDRIFPQRFQMNRRSEPNGVPGGEWLNSWETHPVATINGKEVTLPRRRVVAAKWVLFPGLAYEIPTTFASSTDESGNMNWYRSRTILSVETSNHPNSGIFYMSGYGIPEVAKERGKWTLAWILGCVALCGFIGYWIVPKLVRKVR